MALHAYDAPLRRLVGAALLAGVLCAVAVTAVGWGRLLSMGRYPGATGDVVLSVVYGGALATVLFVPFLLAVLLVIADPSLRTVAVGAGLVYVVDLVVTLGQMPAVGPLSGIELAVLAVPLPRVATFLAVAAGVWLTYHGGYERLAVAAGDAEQHPLLAHVPDRVIAPALPLQRGFVVAGIAGFLAAGGLVVAGGVSDVLQEIGRPDATGVTRVVIRPSPLVDVGVPLDQLPLQWLIAASFVLAVLFVTGPRLRSRDLLKGVAVVLCVQAPLALLSTTEPSSSALELVAGTEAAVTPLADVILLTGIALAVWLAYHGGFEPLEYRIRTERRPE